MIIIRIHITHTNPYILLHGTSTFSDTPFTQKAPTQKTIDITII